MINLANICVLVRTKEEYEKILEEAREQGYKWYGGKDMFVFGDQQFPDILKFYSDKTVTREACPNHEYKLYEASELLGTKELTAREFIDWMVRFVGCGCNNCRKCVLGNENTKCKKMLCDADTWKGNEDELLELAKAGETDIVSMKEKNISIIKNFIEAPDRTKINDEFVECLKFVVDKLKEVK